jgi:hypothetical protein
LDALGRPALRGSERLVSTVRPFRREHKGKL